jgi:integrase/recombinase XerC
MKGIFFSMLRENFEAYLRFERNFAENTRIAYLNDLDSFSSFLQEQGGSLFEEEGARQIRHRSLREWMGAMLASGISHRSVARKLSAVKTYFHFLKRKGVLTLNPANRVKVPKFEKNLPSFLKESETSRMLDEIPFPATLEGHRDKAILELLYGCGLRRSELIRLCFPDLDMYAQTIRVTGKGRKVRILPFGTAIRKSLEAWLVARTEAGLQSRGPLFVRPGGEPLYPQLVYRMVLRYTGLATGASGKSPHVLRHTFATHMLDRGADLNAIKEMLGHSSLASTQVYTHNTISKLKSVHALAHPRATKRK